MPDDTAPVIAEGSYEWYRREVERLRKDLAETRTEKVVALLERIGDWDEIGKYVREIEAEVERLRVEVAQLRAGEDLVDALMGYLNKARDAADAKDWPSLPIAIAALRKRTEQAEAEVKRLADFGLKERERHAAEVERLTKERDALQAATEQVCGRLDWLIANGFGAREADLRDLRAALDQPTEESTDGA